MFNYENLLRNEFFPSELPPCFTTESLADNADVIRNIIKQENVKSSQPLIYSGFKSVNSRRKFAIPNPLHYCKTVDIIVNNSQNIFSIFDINKVSLTCPLNSKPKKYDSYKKPTKNINEIKDKIEQLYQDNLYEIHLDIMSFFDSIYTHSIPWAIHTKKVAKRNRTRSLIGNVLDESMRNMNSAQTNGILVGNAISRIISEIILCKIDEAVKMRLPDISYRRYVDDYYIYTKSSSEIQNIIATFRQELAKYELMINENKTRICESPFSYGKPWVEHMREYLYLNPIIFLRKAIMEYNERKDISILRYGLRVIQYNEFNAKDWHQIESILVNIWVKFPSLSDLIVDTFKSNETSLRKTKIRQAIYSILDYNLVLQNDQEVVWAIWISKVLNIRLSQQYIAKVLGSENYLAIIIMLDIINAQEKEDSNKLKSMLVKLYDDIIEKALEHDDIMFSDLWLVAYEIDRNEWLNVSEAKNFQLARTNNFFGQLLSLNVEFYNSTFEYKDNARIANKEKYITREELNEIMKKIQEYNELQTGSLKENERLNETTQILIDLIHAMAIETKY